MDKGEEGRPATETVAAFERWAYGEGWTAGLDQGRYRGFDEGYRAGFDAGIDLVEGRLLGALERASRGRAHHSPPWLAHLERYTARRGRPTESDETSESQITDDGESGNTP